jgi:hypothetical protein
MTVLHFKEVFCVGVGVTRHKYTQVSMSVLNKRVAHLSAYLLSGSTYSARES